MRIRITAAIGDDASLLIKQEQSILVISGPRKHDLHSRECRDDSFIFFKEKGECIIRCLQDRDAEKVLAGNRKRMQSRLRDGDANYVLGELGTAGRLKCQQKARSGDPIIVGCEIFRPVRILTALEICFRLFSGRRIERPG